MPKNVWILTAAQACLMSSASLIVFAGGLLGAQLSPDPSLATLPVASIILGTAMSTVPVAMTMKSLGRKLTFLLFGLLSVLACGLAIFAILNDSFVLLCISFALMGIGMSSVQQFRFAAMESVHESQAPQAASTVLLGGIAAAFLGPEVGTFGKNLFETDFVGSFVLLAMVFTIGIILLTSYQNVQIKASNTDNNGRTLSMIIRQPVFWAASLSAMIGYAVMSFIMTATPVSMHVMDGHALHHTKWVIQSHIIAMYAPSLIAANVVKWLGINRMIVAGCLLYAICIISAVAGQQLWNYWVSLVLLGVGWNFMFIGGTTLLPRSYQPNERFKVQALNELLVFGAQAIAALSAGYFVFHFGWNTIQWLSLPLLSLPLAALLVLHRANQSSK